MLFFWDFFFAFSLTLMKCSSSQSCVMVLIFPSIFVRFFIIFFTSIHFYQLIRDSGKNCATYQLKIDFTSVFGNASGSQSVTKKKKHFRWKNNLSYFKFSIFRYKVKNIDQCLIRFHCRYECRWKHSIAMKIKYKNTVDKLNEKHQIHIQNRQKMCAIVVLYVVKWSENDFMFGKKQREFRLVFNGIEMVLHEVTQRFKTILIRLLHFKFIYQCLMQLLLIITHLLWEHFMSVSVEFLPCFWDCVVVRPYIIPIFQLHQSHSSM